MSEPSSEPITVTEEVKKQGGRRKPPTLYHCPACGKVGSYSEMMDHAIWDHGLGFEHLKEATKDESVPVVQPA